MEPYTLPYAGGAPSEMEILAGAALLAAGACTIMLGLSYAASRPHQRANPGDAFAALGAVTTIAAAWLMGSGEWMAWTLGALGLLHGARAAFALGHHLTTEHWRTREAHIGRAAKTARSHDPTRRARHRRIAEEAVRRYREQEAAAREADAQFREVRIEPVGPRVVWPDRVEDVVDAEFTEAPDETNLPVPMETVRSWGATAADADAKAGAAPVETQAPTAPEAVEADPPALPPDHGEILVRFETPMDAQALFLRPDRPRSMFDAILSQLGEGSRIVGIRARAGDREADGGR